MLDLVAFGAGNLVQELGDVTIKAWKGPRYFKKARDDFWKTDEALPVKALIKAVLAVLAFIPAARFAWQHFAPTCHYFVRVGSFGLFLIFLTWLSWTRMVRFRDVSQVTVFRAYLATVNEQATAKPREG